MVGLLPPKQPGGAGLQYKPLSPGRSAFAGGLQGLSALLAALATGRGDMAAQAFQGGLQGFEDQQALRQQQADYAEDREYRRKRQEADDTEAAEKRAKRAQAEAKYGELSALFTDDDPTNDPTGLRDLLAYLDPEQGYGAIADMFATPDQTDDQQEYEFAKTQGYEGTFIDFLLENKRAGASSTKVDVHAPTQPILGDVPAGYAAVPDPENPGLWKYVKLPGGPAADAAADKAAKVEGQAQQKQTMSNIVTQDIARTLDIIGKSPKTTTGIGGQLLQNLGGTAANDVRALVQTIRSNVGFDQLQQMRNNSPTGGALGPVSDAENGLLQSVMGNLEQSQTQEQFEYNLKRLNNVILDIVDGPGNGDRYDLGGDKAGADLKSKYGLD